MKHAMLPKMEVGAHMKRFIEGRGRAQWTLFPECLDDAIDADNPVRVVDVFVGVVGAARRNGGSSNRGKARCWRG